MTAAKNVVASVLARLRKVADAQGLSFNDAPQGNVMAELRAASPLVR